MTLHSCVYKFEWRWSTLGNKQIAEFKISKVDHCLTCEKVEIYLSRILANLLIEAFIHSQMCIMTLKTQQPKQLANH